MRPRILIVLGLLAAAFVLDGCARPPSAEQALRSRAFDSAEPPLKELWLTAVSALQTNDYVGPQLILFNLRARPDLTPEQRSVVEQTLKTVSGRMFDAAGRGDARALAAMKELNQARSQGGTRSRK
jgi:uncharacterized lipoprotein YajG